MILGIYFGSYEYFRQALANKDGELSPWRQITAGGLAGTITIIYDNHIEVLI